MISSVLVSVAAFVVLLSMVVIAHEYGHYKTGRLLGIGVERFALGFGPAIYRWTRDGVEYKIGAIPLGGYVKFVGETPGSPVPEELRDKAFNFAPIYKRALTVFAGPMMNIVLGFALFCIIFAAGLPQPAAVIGEVAPDSVAAQAGLTPGDRIAAIDGKPIRFWQDLSQAVSDNPNRPMVFRVVRAGQTLTIPVTPKKITAPDMLYMFQTQRGSIGVSPVGLRPLVGVPDPASPAARAGLQTGDLILSVNGKPVTYNDQLGPALAAASGPLRLAVARGESNIGQERPRAATTIDVPAAAGESWTMAKLGVEPGSMYVWATMPGSPAAAAGFAPGDKLVSVDGAPLKSWEEFTKLIRAHPEKEVRVGVRRAGADATLPVTPRKIENLNAMGQKETYGQIGIQPAVALTPAVEDVERYWNPGMILVRGLQESWTWSVRLVKGVFYMFVGKVPTSSLGGPIAIARMAGESAEMGVIQFLLFTAIISFNLAFVNLLPIPIFDGGHLLLFGIEGIRRRPLSDRGMEIALRVGLALLVALFMLIFFNDFRWVFYKLKGLLGA